MNVTERIGYTPTEEERESISRQAMEAAYDQVKHLAEGDLDERDAILSMLKAFSAAQSAKKRRELQILAKHPDSQYVEYYDDIAHVVCSAVLSLMWGGVDDTNPHNFWAFRFLPLMKAAQAMEAYSSLSTVIGDAELELFGDYGVDDILRVATGNEAK